MTYLEVCDKLRKIYHAIQAATELSMDDSVHGMDKTAIREECIELHRAAHDTMREFESECISRGFANAVKEFEKIADSESLDPVSDFQAKFTQAYR